VINQEGREVLPGEKRPNYFHFRDLIQFPVRGLHEAAALDTMFFT
jgi:hypothetical protein